MVPSPRSHIYRLLALLVAALAGFLALKDFATPDSWDAKKSYRRDALPQLQRQTPLYGGNSSCVDAGCHKAVNEHEAKMSLLRGAVHETLACEGCHGPLGYHARDGEKIADAQLERDNTLCLRCHTRLLGRDSRVAQFRASVGLHKMAQVTQTTRCATCHDPHAPAAKKEVRLQPAAQSASTTAPSGTGQGPARMSCDGGGCHQSPSTHQARAEQLHGAVHRVLDCEVCHGALQAHAAEGLKVGDAKVERNGGLCLRCHGGTPQPGAGMKQFDPEFQVHKLTQTTRESDCFTCHNPHAPK